MFKPKEDWTEAENWVWQQLLRGDAANFNILLKNKLDPTTDDGWSIERQLSSGFLSAIALDEQHQGSLPQRGIHIAGAWVPDDGTHYLDLGHAKLARPFWLTETRIDLHVMLRFLRSATTISFERSVLKGGLDLFGADIEGYVDLSRITVNKLLLSHARLGSQLSLNEATCLGMVKMDSLTVRTNLLMARAQLYAVDLRGATIGGQLSLGNSTCENRLIMNGLTVESGVVMSDSQLQEVDLGYAKVGGQLNLNRAGCQSKLDMGGITIEAQLLMHDARLHEVNLGDANIGGLSLRAATCAGSFTAENLVVGSGVYMDYGARFEKEVSLFSANIKGNVQLAGAAFHNLNLNGAHVHGELHLGSCGKHIPVWTEGANLYLRGTTVGALQAPETLDAWPKHLYLDGFEYTRIGGFSGEESPDDMTSWTVGKFTSWLTRDRSRSPQPYHYLASVLLAAGHSEMASDILYAAKRRERRKAQQDKQYLKWLGLCALEWTIGYGFGFRYFLSLVWVVALTAVGAWVAGTTAVAELNNVTDAAVFSLDRLLPVVDLEKPRTESIFIDGWQRYYFIVHKFIGFVLASFVVAGLSGLTKR